jgi:hypothetical protein
MLRLPSEYTVSNVAAVQDENRRGGAAGLPGCKSWRAAVVTHRSRVFGARQHATAGSVGDRVAAFLRSAKSRLGRVACRGGSPSLADPATRPKVTEYQPLQQPEIEDDAMLAILDALIELHATVPMADAHKLYPRFAAQSTILLVGAGSSAQQALVEIFDRTTNDSEWLAAGNALFRYRTTGFVRRLIDRLTQHVTVSVVGRGPLGVTIYDPAIGCGIHAPAPKKGWPLVARYRLTPYPWPSETLLVDGETPVYYWRTEPGDPDNPPDSLSFCYDGDRDRYRAQYLARLLPYSPLAKRLNAYPDVRLEWRGGAGYRRQLAAAIEERRTLFELAIGNLQALRALMPDEAASLKPRIEVVICDLRSDRFVPLPNVAKDDGLIVIRTNFTKPLL